MRRTIDPKIERIRASWLDLDTTDATWLASVADEVDVPAGTFVGGHRRFTHIVMTGEEAGTRVDPGEPPRKLRDAASVLVLTSADAAELDQRCDAAATAHRVARPALHPAT